MAVKLFGVYRERDNIYLALLAFGMVLSAAVLTVEALSSSPWPVLPAAGDGNVYQHGDAAHGAAVRRCAREHGGDDRKLRSALSGMTLILLLGVLVAAVGLFFASSRRTGGYLSAFTPNNQFVSGFSESVELGTDRPIQQSSIVVMHIQIAGEIRLDATRCCGAALHSACSTGADGKSR